MRLAVDAMGGDRAPDEVVRGASWALDEDPGLSLTLVGRREAVMPIIDASGAVKRHLGQRLEFIPAAEVISSEETGAFAVRRKKDSSINVGLRLVKEGHCDGFLSAGNTGALMAGSLLSFGRVSGIKRPALGVTLPTRQAGRGLLLLDVGANADAKPEYLMQFGIMGSVYVEQIMGIPEPKVALLNIGTERDKGNQLVRESFDLFANSSLNFVGFLESRQLLDGRIDVVVCDGFTGNVLLKQLEGTASAIFGMLKEELMASISTKVGAALAKPAFRRLQKRMDYTEYGGAPLFGLNGACIKCHGSSNAKAIKNGIFVARDYVDRDVLGALRQQIKKV